MVDHAASSLSPHQLWLTYYYYRSSLAQLRPTRWDLKLQTEKNVPELAGSPGRSRSGKSPEEGGGGGGGKFVSSSSSHLAPLWTGGEKRPNKGNTSAPSSRPSCGRAGLGWAGLGPTNTLLHIYLHEISLARGTLPLPPSPPGGGEVNTE